VSFSFVFLAVHLFLPVLLLLVCVLSVYLSVCLLACCLVSIYLSVYYLFV
jgi:hypothetical protein